MAHDAIGQSLSEGDSVLSDYVVALAKRLRAVEDVLAQEMERAQRAEARAASAEALAEANASRLNAATRAEEIIARAAAAAVPAPRHAGRPKRDRPAWLHAVPIAAVATAAAWAALRAAAAWALRTGTRKAVTTATAVAVAGGAVVAAPDMTHAGPAPVPAVVHPAPPMPVQLPRHRHHAVPAGLVPPVTVHRRRRVHQRQDAPDPDPSPSASPSPSPSPSVSPSPGPSITPSAGAEAIADRVLGTLTGLLWQGMAR